MGLGVGLRLGHGLWLSYQLLPPLFGNPAPNTASLALPPAGPAVPRGHPCVDDRLRVVVRVRIRIGVQIRIQVGVRVMVRVRDTDRVRGLISTHTRTQGTVVRHAV